MMQLSREIRFALVEDYDNKITNSWSAWPATNLVAPQLRLQCEIEGSVDKNTGYICNIKEIDDLLRSAVTKKIIPEFEPKTSAESLIQKIFDYCQNNWKSEIRIVRQTLFLSPCLSYSIESSENQMIELTQQFEFSASHRLHCDDLSDEENREIFGKCNNPNGHGHNYVFEVTIRGSAEVPNGQLINLHRFESIVKENVVDVLDHKHLNEDVELFKTTNPSVENITKAIWEWLEGKFDRAKLSQIKVYETPKTWAKYTGR